jgi:hypothetical protein
MRGTDAYRNLRTHGSVGLAARVVCGSELVGEYAEITERMTTAPLLALVDDYATLCAVAVARVKVLDRKVGHVDA